MHDHLINGHQVDCDFRLVKNERYVYCECSQYFEVCYHK